MPEQKTIIHRRTVKPKIYAIVVRGHKGSVLHMGIYTSLDDAFVAAKNEIGSLTHDQDRGLANIDTWVTLELEQVLAMMNGGIAPTPNGPLLPAGREKPKAIKEQIESLKTQKNDIMKHIIESGDVAVMKQARTILSKNEIEFVTQSLLSKTK